MRTLVLLFLLVAVTAEAQEVTVSGSTSRDFWADANLDLPRSLNVIGTVSFSDRFALEPFWSRGAVTRPHGREGMGLYGVQVRQRISRYSSPQTMTFVTYGIGGYYDARSVRPPLMSVLGAGVRHRLLGRVAVRPEMQVVSFTVMPMGVRFIVGVSVNVGREP